MAEYDGYEITTGFLTGNFGEDIDPVATANAWQQAIKSEFPGAAVEVGWQHAEGTLPWGLKTHVYRNGEPVAWADDEAIRATIDALLERVEPVWKLARLQSPEYRRLCGPNAEAMDREAREHGARLEGECPNCGSSLANIVADDLRATVCPRCDEDRYRELMDD